ncbi:hypothetical protein ACM614_03460, partial [Streptomyces sp. 12297]
AGLAVPASRETAGSSTAARDRGGTAYGGATGPRFFGLRGDIETVLGSGVFGGCQILSKSGLAETAWAAGTARRDVVRARISGPVTRIRVFLPERRMPKRGITHPPMKK